MRLSSFILIFLTTLLFACTQHPFAAEQTQPTRKHSMTTQTPWIEPEIFATIATNEDGLTPCTPAEPNVRRWRGIIINAPTVARARAGQAFLFLFVCLARFQVLIQKNLKH